MNPKPCLNVAVPVFAIFLIYSSISAHAFNITKILNNYPNLIAFNDLLTQTKLSETINSRRTITVLAVDNSSLAGLQNRDMDEIQKVLSDHVILDYYDRDKLKKLPKQTTVTTLYQTSGIATGRQGFLNVSKVAGGDIVFGSAVKDAVPVSKLLNVVFTQPYNVSILRVSQPIVAPGIGEVILPPPPPPFTPPPAEPPKHSPGGADSPADAPDEAEGPSDSPVEAPAEAPATAPDATPAHSPPSPSEDDGSTDSTPPSAAPRMYLGTSVIVATFMALFFNFVEF